MRGFPLTQAAAAAAAAESADRGPETLWVSSCSGLGDLGFLYCLLPPQKCGSLAEHLLLTVCLEQGTVSG